MNEPSYRIQVPIRLLKPVGFFGTFGKGSLGFRSFHFLLVQFISVQFRDLPKKWGPIQNPLPPSSVTCAGIAGSPDLNPFLKAEEMDADAGLPSASRA
jgi:hypothetical protein